MNALEFRDVTVAYGSHVVVDSLSLTVPAGKIIGLVGESGCGKSTLGRAAVGLVPVAGGSITLGGKPIRNGSLHGLQMVFQDPYASFDPRMSIGRSVAEALPQGGGLSKAQRQQRVEQLLEQVSIDPARHGERPGQLSGGQRQRVGIARALAAEPSVIVADEITSALDASVQGAVLNLVRNLQTTLSVGMLFISHNMAAVRYVSDEIAVMHEGKIVEMGPGDRVVHAPEHPYTRTLLDAARLELQA
ncbi:ABC transporter ATP-binding protein [Arthrobacter sp. 18067]|uniref:ABC transporter ATP-binding protein n=1 Tax=Arthrobacter sp. 18067 TaxID=2681413 RepID=UPI001358C289|nr:ATP-binding cassette domain-containing protein [Arthrobacter sp. 18067]